MAKEKKHFKVDFKGVNAKLKTTKKQLEKIRKKVSKKDQKAIAAEIKAINVLLSACASTSTRIGPPMSAVFTEK